MIKDLLKSTVLKPFNKAIKQGETFLIEELWDSPKAILASVAQFITEKRVLIITGRASEENRLFDDLSLFFDGAINDFPAWETLPSENIPPSPDIVGQRYEILKSLLDNDHKRVVIASVQACLQKVIAPSRLSELWRDLAVGDHLPFEAFIDDLLKMGYQHKQLASDKGEFAVRGGIIDVFPVSSPDPFRVDFWGDEVDSIRIYDAIGQLSVEKVNKISITPAQELEMMTREGELASILDYFGDDGVIIFDNVLAIEDRYEALESLPDAISRPFSSFNEFFQQTDNYQRIFLSETDLEAICDVRLINENESAEDVYSGLKPIYDVAFDLFEEELKAKRWLHPFQKIRDYFCPPKEEEENLSGAVLLQSIRNRAEVSGEDILQSISGFSDKNLNIEFLCTTDSDEEKLKKTMKDLKVCLPNKVTYKRAYLSTGFVLDSENLALFPLTEITGRYHIRRQKMRSTHHVASFDVYELEPGDFVVHLHSGIGRFLNIERKINHNGIEVEFFQIEYADNAKLFVPFSQAHLISKYVGTKEGEILKLHVMGGNRWKKTRKNVETAIMSYASELLHLYAQREIQEGFSYPEDTEEVIRFGQDFPYEETDDQKRAITDIKKDMLSKQPMDRLICGDVGYGKTEVAMRAAFKVVLNGCKQVAVLVPTTVLAMQHFETFTARMWNYPVRVGVLSRFRTPKEIKETLLGAANGTVDILIGTHRIISKDVAFKDLGLVIIDEEQRFGVKAKEYLKTLKTTVDCMTLSATPIPRTLYMALFGARDMSVINTPPQDRLPIKSVICETDDKMIKNALLRELTRDGQAFFIHNRVETIDKIALNLRKLIPGARVAIAHGQMPADQIDDVFHQFKEGSIDILVATTIIESGIDIPNANTIIVDRADRFGLADLYQMRGRVGRWNRRAYAYFLTPKKRVLTPIVQKRLDALSDVGAYGGGMKIAMRDLEIRGAGNLIGTEQSGQVSSIGFHLYCKLLRRTIDALEGKLSSTICETKIEFSYDARLPEEYVNATSLRLEIYQRLGEAISEEVVDRVMEEVIDRYGKLPEPAEWLWHLMRVRVFASRYHITQLKVQALSVTAEGKLNGKTLVLKSLLKKPKGPKDLEKKLIAFLKKGFNL